MMKLKKVFFGVILAGIIIIVINTTLALLDETYEKRFHRVSEQKIEAISFGQDVCGSLVKAEHYYVNALLNNHAGSANKLRELLQYHTGRLPRPADALLYPFQTKSNLHIAQNLASNPMQAKLAEQLSDAYTQFLQWAIEQLENARQNPEMKLAPIVWPDSRNLTLNYTEAFVLQVQTGINKEYLTITRRSSLLSVFITTMVIFSPFFFGFLILYLYLKLLKPYVESKQKLATVDEYMFNAANMAFWEYDFSKNVYVGGPEFARFFGVSGNPVEVTTEDLLSQMKPIDRKTLLEKVNHSIQSKIPKAAYEVTFTDMHGSKRIMQILAVYTYDEDGTLVRRHGIVQDITALRKIEQQLQLSQGKLEEVLYQLEIGVAEVSPVWSDYAMVDLRFNHVNEAFCRIFQQPASEINGKNYSEVFQFFGNAWVRLMSRYLKGNVTTNTTEIYNTSLHKWLKIKVYRESEFRIIAFVEDITEERTIRQSLKKSQERMMFSEKMARFGYCEYDIVNKTLNGNQVAFEIHGLTKSPKLTADDFMQVLVPGDEHILRTFAEQLKAQKHTEGTYRVLVNDEIRYIHCKLETVDSNTLKNRAFGFVHDITDAKKGELELIEAKEKAEESDQLKNAFLANMSHEIRTPLSAILGFSSILAKNEVVDDEQRRECQNLIEKNSNALMILINDVIEMAKIESGETTIRPISFDLNQFMEDAYNMFSAELLKKGRSSLRLFKQTATEGEYRIFADQDRLNQVMNNLISNAIKFTPKGFIEFGYQLQDDKLIFFVRDSGIGIDEEKKEVIFKMFRQADLNIAGEFGGTGLGLAICEKLIHLMNGRIWVESVKGVGSTFFFSLPLVKEYTKAVETVTPVVAPPESVPDFSGKVILVADDEEFIHVLFRNYLTATGVRVLSTYDGAHTVETIQSDTPIDLVLLDMRMPEMNGEDAVIEIRKHNPTLPVIAQTAYAFEGDKDRFLAAGCTDYLSKPIKEDELLQLLSRYLLG